MRHMKAPADATSLPPGRPYRKSIARWNEWIGDAVSGRNRAYLVALGALGVAGIAVWDAGAERSKRELPQVLLVERDSNANVIAVSDARAPRPLTQAQISLRFRTWVFNTRSVLVDYQGLRTVLTNGYAATKAGTEAYKQLTSYHQANPPEEKATRASTYVYRQTALPLGNNTWQVDWCERVISRDGVPMAVEAWRMTATHTIERPTSKEAALINPDGWYITNFGWHRVQDGREALQNIAAQSRSGASMQASAAIPTPEQCG